MIFRRLSPALLSLAALILSTGWTPRAHASTPQAIAAPVLKWQRGGCYASWCETGWYASPAAADLDGDGRVEVIGAAYSLVVLDGETGALLWRVASGHDRAEPGAGSVGRTWPDVAVADLDGDGSLEIASAHSGGTLSVYNHQGYFEPGWPQQIAGGSELRSLGLYDLEGDGQLEILAAGTRSENQWYALEPDGSLRPGAWPQHNPDSDTNGYTAGCYNQNLAAGDLDGDGRAEIVGPNDTHYLAAFEDDGSQVRASTMFGANLDGSPKVWSRVGVHVDQAVDLRGYAQCGLEHRPNFAHSAPAIADVDGDGTQEAIVVGNVYNCGADPYQDLYEIPYLLSADRTRWHASGFDWTVLPSPEPGAAPLSEDYDQIENSHPNPVPADLDGDGRLEILYPSYDGRLHAYWLDKTEHGDWPVEVTHPAEGLIRFASEPVVADLDADGKAEVIFTTWTQKGSNAAGQLVIANAMGAVLQAVDLPREAGMDWNGALAAPTLANLDEDPDLEVVANTAHTGLVAYDLPGTARVRLLWSTGRGSYQRSGSYLIGDLHASMRSDRPLVSPGEALTITITLQNSGAPIDRLSLEDSLPVGLSFAGGLHATSGTPLYQDRRVTWSGRVAGSAPVSLSFRITVDGSLSGRQAIRNHATLNDGQGSTWEVETTIMVNGLGIYLPSIQK